MRLYPIDQVHDLFQRKGYVPLRMDGILNLVGVRLSRIATNRFDDTFIAIVYTRNGIIMRHYACTTDPGEHYLLHGLEKGTAILKPGQYVDAYALGKHQGKYTALVQVAPVTVYRDTTKDTSLDYTREETGMFGINIHRANPSVTSAQVDKWSAGCTVIASPNDFNDLINLAFSHKPHGHGRFTYTLLEDADFWSIEHVR